MAGPYWVVAEGRGTALTAYVIGPQSTAPTAGFAGSSYEIVGSQTGYPNKLVATQAAAIYNAGGKLPNDPSQAAVSAAASTEPAGGKFSNAGITNRDQQAGGTVGTIPVVANPLDWLSNIADFFDRLSQANTWIRIAEFVLGGALVLVGVAHMAKGTPVGDAAGKIAKTAGLLALA